MLFLYPLYIINFKDEFNWKDFSIKVLAVLILLVSLLTFQSLVTKKGLYSGDIGNFIIDSMFPFIGFAGLWIFVLIALIVSALILFEDSELNINPKKYIPTIPKFKHVDTTVKPKRIESKKRERRTVKKRG